MMKIPGPAFAGIGRASGPPNPADRPGQMPGAAPPARAVVASFSYESVAPDVAVAARNAATRIRNRLRDSVIETGRDLLAIKAKMAHGTFGDWMHDELGMNARTAENYMNAARFVEGKSETVAFFSPAALYALASPSAPVEVVNEILAAADAGTLMPAGTIRAKLSDAVKAQEKNAAVKTAEQIKKDRENEKRRRAVDESRRRKEEEEHKIRENEQNIMAIDAAKFLMATLKADGLEKLLKILGSSGWHRVEKVFGAGGIYSVSCPITAEKIEANFKARIAL